MLLTPPELQPRLQSWCRSSESNHVRLRSVNSCQPHVKLAFEVKSVLVHFLRLVKLGQDNHGHRLQDHVSRTPEQHLKSGDCDTNYCLKAAISPAPSQEAISCDCRIKCAHRSGNFLETIRWRWPCSSQSLEDDDDDWGKITTKHRWQMRSEECCL